MRYNDHRAVLYILAQGLENADKVLEAPEVYSGQKKVNFFNQWGRLYIFFMLFFSSVRMYLMLS